MDKYIDFFPFGNSAIELEFECNECHNTIKTERFGLPHPNYMAEKASDSYVDREEFVICENCQKEFIIDINVGYADAYVLIIGLKEEDEVEIIEIPDEYDDYYIDEQINCFLLPEDDFSYFISEIEKLKELNKIQLSENKLDKILKRQIYSNSITCLEFYLSEMLLKKVLSDISFIESYASNYMGYNDQKLNLVRKNETNELLKQEVFKALIHLVCHRLDKIEKRYELFFNIIFPDYTDIDKIINIRHIIIHRNGKNSQGKEILLDTNEVNNAIDKVEKFVTDINSLIFNKINEDDDELPW